MDGGALKQTDDGRWAHISCGLWVPKARLGDITTMQPVEGVNAALQHQRVKNQVCSICLVNHGAAIKCSQEGCAVCIHPLCAWYSGLYMHVKTVGIDCNIFMYCSMHTPALVLEPYGPKPPHVQHVEHPSEQKHQRTTRSRVRKQQQQQKQEMESTVAADVGLQQPQVITRPVLPLGYGALLPVPGLIGGGLGLNALVPNDQRAITRILQQRELRNTGRLDQHRKSKSVRRRMQSLEGRRRQHRLIANREDKYEPNRCAVCFQTNTDVLFNMFLDDKEVESKTGQKPMRTTEQLKMMRRKLVMVRCDICDIDVHQSCYGVSDAKAQAILAANNVNADADVLQANSGAWECERCHHAEQKTSISCAVCPRRGGAFKKTIHGDWCHVACARWLPELYFMDVAKMGPIGGTRNVAVARQRLKCYLCKRPGPCRQCDSSQCTIAFHTLCGLFSGVFMSVIERGKAMNMIARCRRHTTLHLTTGIDIPEEYSRLVLMQDQMLEAKQILQSVQKREKVKTSLVKTEFELMDARFKEVSALPELAPLPANSAPTPTFTAPQFHNPLPLPAATKPAVKKRKKVTNPALARRSKRKAPRVALNMQTM
jgi:hypothetical protein